MVEVRDPVEDVLGTLVIDRLVDGVAAGGLRISTEADRKTLLELAAAMTRKQAAFGIRVGGAKAGLTMDPRHPAREAVLERFVRSLRPYIAAHWSVGPDLNTSMAELEAIGRGLGLPSLKLCVGRARGLSEEDFLNRYALFEAPVGGASDDQDGGHSGGQTRRWTVNQLRGPSAVAASVIALLEHLGVDPKRARVAIQGAGTMGGGAAHLLARAGIPVTTWADDRGCLSDPDGLPVAALLNAREHGRLPKSADAQPSATVLQAECDVLVLAAVSRAIAPAQVEALRCRGIVEAANLAIDVDVADTLVAKDVLIVPDILASAGGSLAVESLYAATPTCGQDILDHVSSRVRERLSSLIPAATAAKTSLRSLVLQPPSAEEAR